MSNVPMRLAGFLLWKLYVGHNTETTDTIGQISKSLIYYTSVQQFGFSRILKNVIKN